MTDLTQPLSDDEQTAESHQDTTPRSLRGAINRHCKSCVYDPLDKGGGNWRQQVDACTVFKCELYPVRPGSKPKKRLLPPDVT